MSFNSSDSWLRRARAKALSPRAAPRWDFEIAGTLAGSVLPAHAPLLTGVAGVVLEDEVLSITPVCGHDASAVLQEMAARLRAASLAPFWRDELLAVRAQDGTILGEVERGVTRALGTKTYAVHLNGVTADGSIWLQQRALNKSQDPGKWDTLVGGMVAGRESFLSSLERETQEEAGLELQALGEIRYAGTLTFERPVEEGHLVEDILCYEAVLPEGMQPQNQDGEVAQFQRVSKAELQRMLQAEDFTLEASLVLALCLDLGES